MILIYPPISKPCEPPAGLARIAGALTFQDIDFTLLDANLEGMLFLLESLTVASDTWTRRSLNNLGKNLLALKNPFTYANISRYSQAATEINRVLAMASRPYGVRMSLADYHDEKMSPVRSADLIRAAENYEKNPFFSYFKKRIPPLLEEKGTATIGISLSYLSQALSAFAMIGFLKKNDPNLRIILGGSLITSWMSNPGWKNPFSGLADEVVAGPGEEWLIAQLKKNQPGRSVQASPLKIPEKQYIPCFDHFPRDAYLSPGLIIPYSASSGCYWRKCSFCPEKAEKNRYSPAKEDDVLHDLEVLKKKHSPALIHFLDNAMSPGLLLGIAENDDATPWYGFTRITDHLADPEFCRTLKRSGCVMLKLGLESGDQNILDDLNKGINLKTVSLALCNLKKTGIAVYIYLLFGTAAETIAEARNTLDFSIRHKDYIDFFNLAIFNLPAYGPDVEKLKVSQFYEGDLSLYSNFEHPEGWGRPQVRQFLDGEFKREPSIADILRRTPPLFTSNHAPFFCMAHTERRPVQ